MQADWRARGREPQKMSAFKTWEQALRDVAGAVGNSGRKGTAKVCMKATRDLLRTYKVVKPTFRYNASAMPRRCLTKPERPMYNDNFDNVDHDYILYVNDVLVDTHHNQEFVVLDLLGIGTFGQVVKCVNRQTQDVVAVKVIKNQQAYFNQAWVEVNILNMLHRKNPPEDTRHIVNLFSHFVFRNHLCLVFEKLSINLFELIKQNHYNGISLDMLRTIIRQLMSTLVVLCRSEVIHCDLKPENILLKSVDSTEVKLIDLGSAAQQNHVIYSYVQSRFYRSPEVLLGLPTYDSKIDVWSLGCVAGELFLGIPLFPGQNEMNMVCRIAEMLGKLPDSFLQRCRDAPKFFNVSRGGLHLRYSLKSPEQYERENGKRLPEWKRYFRHTALRDIIMNYPFRSNPPSELERALRESFIDLLGGLLKVDPLDRWSPEEAIGHPFLQAGPLPNGKPWSPPSRRRGMFFPRPRALSLGTAGDGADDVSRFSSSAPGLFSASGFAGFSNHCPATTGLNLPTATEFATSSFVGAGLNASNFSGFLAPASRSYDARSSSIPEYPGLAEGYSRNGSQKSEPREAVNGLHFSPSRESTTVGRVSSQEQLHSAKYTGDDVLGFSVEDDNKKLVASATSGLPPAGRGGSSMRRKASSSNHLSSLGMPSLGVLSHAGYGAFSFSPQKHAVASVTLDGSGFGAGSAFTFPPTVRSNSPAPRQCPQGPQTFPGQDTLNDSTESSGLSFSVKNEGAKLPPQRIYRGGNRLWDSDVPFSEKTADE